jgi:glycosyltransferase involved in cell wall biosynthesis
MAELADLSLSVVIPAYNSAETLERCLNAVTRQLAPGDEVIVVDDGSTDDVAAVASRFRATIVRLDRRSGVAAARNRGADRATRPVLFFVDADVVLHPDAIASGRARFVDPSVDAVIGSYDDTPAARTMVSQFKNLAHHWASINVPRVASDHFGVHVASSGARSLMQSAGSTRRGSHDRPLRTLNLGGVLPTGAARSCSILKYW